MTRHHVHACRALAVAMVLANCVAESPEDDRARGLGEKWRSKWSGSKSSEASVLTKGATCLAAGDKCKPGDNPSNACCEALDCSPKWAKSTTQFVCKADSDSDAGPKCAAQGSECGTAWKARSGKNAPCCDSKNECRQINKWGSGKWQCLEPIARDSSCIKLGKGGCKNDPDCCGEGVCEDMGSWKKCVAKKTRGPEDDVLKIGTKMPPGMTTNTAAPPTPPSTPAAVVQPASPPIAPPTVPPATGDDDKFSDSDSDEDEDDIVAPSAPPASPLVQRA